MYFKYSKAALKLGASRSASVAASTIFFNEGKRRSSSSVTARTKRGFVNSDRRSWKIGARIERLMESERMMQPARQIWRSEA